MVSYALGLNRRDGNKIRVLSISRSHHHVFRDVFVLDLHDNLHTSVHDPGRRETRRILTLSRRDEWRFCRPAAYLRRLTVTVPQEGVMWAAFIVSFMRKRRNESMSLTGTGMPLEQGDPIPEGENWATSVLHVLTWLGAYSGLHVTNAGSAHRRKMTLDSD